MKRNICKDRKKFFKVAFKEALADGKIEDYEKFSEIPEDEYEDVMRDNLYNIVFETDGRNIDVSTENVDGGGEFTDGGIDGLQALPTGELFWGFDCGGDWEIPVNAILYVEDGELKFYAPEKGNNFCTEHMCAWGSEPNHDSDEETHDDPIDTREEIDDIKDYFHNRADGQHADGLGVKNDDEPEELPENIKDLCEKHGVKICRDDPDDKQPCNELYFVNTSVWCMRGNSDGQYTVSANSSNSYPNVFGTYEKALEYAHLMMMVNHNCQLHNWDKFKETIDIVENGAGFGEHGEGYVHHPMENGVERFEGFDRNGHYPCLFDDITITKRIVHAVKHDCEPGSPIVNVSNVKLEPVTMEHFIKGEKTTEFTEAQSEDNQKAIERITKEMGGIEDMFDGDDKKQREYDRMKKMLGWDDEDGK